MDLKQALLQEHSKSQILHIVEYIGHDNTRFAELMKVFFAGEYRATQRAAWAMSSVIQRHPALFEEYTEKAVAYLQHPTLHNAVARNVLRILPLVFLPEHIRGNLVDICLNKVQDPKQPGAIKAFSITVLKKLCHLHPELAPEITFLLKERLPYEAPAFKVRAKDFLKDFPS